MTVQLIFLFSANAKSLVFYFVKQLQGCHKGNKFEGVHLLKNYLKEFGYLNQTQANDGVFNEVVESGVKTYRRNFHIKPTRVLDSETVSTMIAPRCGVPDIINGTNHMQPDKRAYGPGPDPSPTFFHIVSHYNFFLPAFPTVAIGPVRSTFLKWATATRYFTFVHVATNQASDISIGLYQGAHGDNAPFDGPGRTLAHSFAPTNGRIHCDADKRWSIGPVPNSFDLETVALHEIGHVIGLGHSHVKDSIMFPCIAPGKTQNIHVDDIGGIRILYNY